MADEPRYIAPDSLVEITMVILQNRYLLRPSLELNDIVLGVFGLAQKRYGMRVCGVNRADEGSRLGERGGGGDRLVFGPQGAGQAEVEYLDVA